jgi:ATP-dependent DNA ligase
VDVDEAVLDGEIIASDETAAPCFSTCYGGRGNLPTSLSTSCGSVDLWSLPLRERRRGLEGILLEGSAVISSALSVQGRGEKLFELIYNPISRASSRKTD